jgi:hypothetical protein
MAEGLFRARLCKTQANDVAVELKPSGFDRSLTLAPSAKNGRDWPGADWRLSAIEMSKRAFVLHG